MTDVAVESDPSEMSEPARPRRPARGHAGVLLIVVVAAALRAAWLLYARPVPVSDFLTYHTIAEQILDNRFFGITEPTAWRLPTYPVYLAAGMLISRSVLFLSAWTAALSVLQAALTYWLAWLIFRRRSAALVAGLAAAVAPAFVMFAPVLASEHMLAVLMLLALIVALHAERRTKTMALLAGVLTGLAVLTRGEAGAYLPAVMLVVGVGAWRSRAGGESGSNGGSEDGSSGGSEGSGDGARPARRLPAAAGAAALVLAGATLVVTPWIVRNNVVVGTGAGLSTTGGFNFYLAHSPGPYGWRTPLPLPLQVEDEVLRNAFGWRYGLQYVRNHPEDWAPTIRRGTLELLAPSSYAGFYATTHYEDGHLAPRPDLAAGPAAIRLAGTSSLWLLWAGLAGLLLVPVWRGRAWFAMIAIVAANWLVYAVVFWAQARYRFVIDALACVAVGAVPATIAATTSWMSRRSTATEATADVPADEPQPTSA